MFQLATGLILTYLICSLISSQIQELIATVFEWRAKDLKNGIAYLFGEKSQNDAVVSKFYNNSLIQGLNHKGNKRFQSQGPSYISGSTFSKVFMEIIKTGQETYPTLDELINDVKSNPDLPESLKQSLFILSQKAKFTAKDASQELNQMIVEVENWFNSSMDRLSGVYKRNAKAVALIIALSISVFANVDTIYIATRLFQDKALQSTIDKVATQVVSSNSCLQLTEDNTNKADCLAEIKSNITETSMSLSPLPFGWDLSHPWQKQLSPFNLNNFLKILFGWLLTTIAISMGAPFWFDLLTTFINVRNAGKKPND